MPRQSGQSTCESKSGSSTTTGVGHTAHSVERLRLTALRSWVKSHLSRKRWKVRTTSRKSEFGTANGGSTKSSANIIGARRNPCSLRAPRVPMRQRNGLQKSETMSANRTVQAAILSSSGCARRSFTNRHSAFGACFSIHVFATDENS